ncbi:MAG: hypothetical protein MUC96_14225, partial [Myxococcaceae bacterium]|nr:hypothetical protein [Myxococcaceae bacterium]
MPSPEPLDELLARARATEPPAVPLPAPEALRRREASWRRRQVGAMALSLLPVVAWVVSVVAHPVSQTLCDVMDREVLLRLGALPALVLLVAAPLPFVERPWAQVVVRGVWWSLHVAGALLTWTRPGLLPLAFPVAGAAAGVALLLLGRRGFEPFTLPGTTPWRRHTTTLLVCGVLAIADALTLTFVAAANDGGGGRLVGVALVLLAGMVLLSRQRLAGLVLSAGGNVGLAAVGLMGGDAWSLPTGLGLALAASALVQLTLLANLAVTLHRGLAGDLPTARPGLERALRGLVVGAALASIIGGVLPPDSNRLAQSCAASRG